MIRIFSAVVLLIAGIACLAQAQISQTGAGKATPAPPIAAYTGPGDLQTFAGWWGFRCYSNAYNGNMADIVDGSTGNTTGTRLQCATGNVITADASVSDCTFVTGNACSSLATTCAVSCLVITLYDQTGGGKDLTRGIGTLSAVPTFSASCAGLTAAKPYCMSGVQANSTFIYNTTGFTYGSLPFGYVAAARPDAAVFGRIMGQDAVNDTALEFDAATPSHAFITQDNNAHTLTSSVTQSAGVWAGIVGYLDNTTSAINVYASGGSATDTTGSLASSAQASGGIGVLAGYQGNTNPIGTCTCTVSEAGILTTGTAGINTSGTRAALNNNIQAYWGF